MQAFHNDPSIKQKYLDRVIAHQKADELIKGKYWENGKGCAVGCTIHSSKHKNYEKELGIPEWLARIEDTIFEGLTNKESQEWPQRFLSAIKPGIDLEKAKPEFLLFVLRSVLDKFDHSKFPDVKKCVDNSIVLWSRTDIGSSSWNKAARVATAKAATRAEARVAGAAEWAERVATAKAAIRAAASAARAATEPSWVTEAVGWAVETTRVPWVPAQASAWAAVKTMEYTKFADELIRIIESL